MVEIGGQPFHNRQQRFTGAGQRHIARITVEQAGAQLLFQQADRTTEGGLRYMGQSTGFAETAIIGDLQKQPQAGEARGMTHGLRL